MTTSEIYNRITSEFISNPEVIAQYGLSEGKSFNDQFSIVNIERIKFFIIAVVVSFCYRSFDQLKLDVVTMLREKKAHTDNWYADISKQFQYGYDLVQDTDQYDNSALTEEQVERSKIVKFADALSKKNKSMLYVKVATGTLENKKQLSQAQLSAFKSYLNLVQDAGVHIQVINAPADELYVEMDIYYNPRILNKYGQRLDGSNDTPVQDAIKSYAHNLQFNGVYVNAHMVDVVQLIDGVEFPQHKRSASRHGAYTDFREIAAKETPYSGYYTVKDANLKLKFLPYDQ